MTTSYTLKYDTFHGDVPPVQASTLNELAALIRQHVTPDDYCWIYVLEDGKETGRGQYYRSEQPDLLVEAIEEHDAAERLAYRLNENAKVELLKEVAQPMHTPVTAEMLQSAYQQTQREILAREQAHERRWERMAQILNKHVAQPA